MTKALSERKVKLHVDTRARELAGDVGAKLLRATDKHYATEFLAMEMAVKVVDSLEEAIEHIDQYGTGHSEAIITSDQEASSGSGKASMQPSFTSTPPPASPTGAFLDWEPKLVSLLRSCTRGGPWLSGSSHR